MWVLKEFNMNYKEDKDIIHKELDLIQGVITRMASNSFEVKKWLIGILSVVVVPGYPQGRS